MAGKPVRITRGNFDYRITSQGMFQPKGPKRPTLRHFVSFIGTYGMAGVPVSPPPLLPQAATVDPAEAASAVTTISTGPKPVSAERISQARKIVNNFRLSRNR